MAVKDFGIVKLQARILMPVKTAQPPNYVPPMCKPVRGIHLLIPSQ